ncbi:ubiquitin carboxyl-terminal hydrolase 48 [Cryptococcus neoformans]|nr:ubiquitin carboxyl-terminal hydrolase 48 [Cryptococcus neoformans var. grubii]
MPPKGQMQKDTPLSEDPNPVGVEDDFKASSLMQMQNTIIYLSEVWEENRHVSILEVANNSVECAGLLAWVDNIGWMMETNGESNWDVWVVVFKDAVLPLEWAVSEQRSLHHLQFATARNWAAFNTQATQHHHNLMGTDRYPSDAQMALVYCAACPDSLYPCVKMKWAYKSGSLHEI